jgi:hypothetical protein
MGGIDDRSTRQKWKIDFIPAHLWSGLLPGAGASTGLENGAPVLQETAGLASGTTAVEIALVADALSTLYHLPNDFDIEQASHWRVIWESLSPDGTDTITFTLTYAALSVNGPAMGLGATPAGALMPAIAADLNSTVPHAVQATPAGILQPGVLTARDAALGGTEFLQLLLVASTFAAGDFNGLNELPHFLGVQVGYVPKRFTGRPGGLPEGVDPFTDV